MSKNTEHSSAICNIIVLVYYNLGLVSDIISLPVHRGNFLHGKIAIYSHMVQETQAVCKVDRSHVEE